MKDATCNDLSPQSDASSPHGTSEARESTPSSAEEEARPGNGVAHIGNGGMNQKCIIEIPPSAKEGDIINFSWPINNEYRIFAIKVPARNLFDESNKDSQGERRLAQIVFSPECIQDRELISSVATGSEERLRHHEPPVLHSPKRKRLLLDEGNEYNSMPMSPRSPMHKARSHVSIEQNRQHLRDFIPVGSLHQVPSSAFPDPRNWNGLRSCCYDMIWDPAKATEAEKNGQKIYDFIAKLPTNKKEIFMECLHNCKYNVNDSWNVFLDKIGELNDDGKIHGEPFTSEDTKQFNRAIVASVKDFGKICNSMNSNAACSPNMSLCSILVHYYSTYKPSKKYKTLKQLCKNQSSSSDYCKVCDDGGKLICCDHCDASYHFDCLKPPLLKPPKGKWACPQCSGE